MKVNIEVKKEDLTVKNWVPIIISIITASSSYAIAYLQFGNSPSNKIDSEKVVAIADKEFDLKIAPINVKLDNVVSDLNTYNSNQQVMNQNIIDILKQLSQKTSYYTSPDSIAKNDVLDKLKKTEILQKKNTVLIKK